MKLLTHNILCCNVKGCRAKDVSLALAIEKSEIIEREYDANAVIRMASLFNWPLLASIVHAVTFFHAAR